MNAQPTNMGTAIAAAGGEGNGSQVGNPSAAPTSGAVAAFGKSATANAQPNAGQQAVNQTNKDILGAIQKNQPGQQTAAGSEFGTDATFAAAQQQTQDQLNAQGQAGQAVTRGLGQNSGTIQGQQVNPDANAAPAASTPAAWSPTPEQQKWLGGANPQDPYVLSRMPGPKPPVSYFKDPKDQKIASGRGMPFAKESVESDGQLLTADPALARIVSLINYGK
jgi:hypothetical protein